MSRKDGYVSGYEEVVCDKASRGHPDLAPLNGDSDLRPRRKPQPRDSQSVEPSAWRRPKNA